MTIPCGKCAACLTNKQNDWSTRLRHELRASDSAYFVTLTYENEKLTYGSTDKPILVKRDIQLFIKKLRRKQDKKLKYFLVGEYGEKTYRPHYHALLFNVDRTLIQLEKHLLETWQNGNIHIGTVTPASIKYTTNYMVQKQEMQDHDCPPFALMSKGLGNSYVEKHGHRHKQDSERAYITFEDGQKSRIPRYYRDKIYSKHQKALQAKKGEILSDKLDILSHKDFRKKFPGKSYHYYKLQQQLSYNDAVNKKLKTNSKF